MRERGLGILLGLALQVVSCGKQPESPPSTPKPEEKKSEETPKVEEKAPAPQKVEVKKDPLAYKVQELPGGTVAIFENWRYASAGGDGTWALFDMAPSGRETEFLIRLAIGTPERSILENFFTEGPRYMQQILPGFQRVGEQKKCRFGGDDAMIEEYEGSPQGKKLLVRMVYLRKGDIAVAVAGFGTEAGYRDYGRAIEIVAQSLSFKESPLEPGLTGTWALETYYSSKTGASDHFNSSTGRYITIYPNGTFTEATHTGAFSSSSLGTSNTLVEGADRGKVVKRGNVLTFTYDNGKTWSAAYELLQGGLKLNGSLYLRQ